MKVVYVAHPLGAGADRERNRANAQRWVAWFAKHYNVAPVADWILLSGEWDESMREQGLAIDMALIERCDEVWLCGGRISAGMALEEAKAVALGKTVKDFTHIGYEAPGG